MFEPDGYAAAFAPISRQALYEHDLVFFAWIKSPKAFLKSSPDKDRLMFHLESSEGVGGTYTLLELEDGLDELDCEAGLALEDDGVSFFEFDEEVSDEIVEEVSASVFCGLE